MHHGSFILETRTSAFGAVSYADSTTARLVMQATSPRPCENAIPASGKKQQARAAGVSAFFFEAGDAAATAGVSLGIEL